MRSRIACRTMDHEQAELDNWVDSEQQVPAEKLNKTKSFARSGRSQQHFRKGWPNEYET
jgi:hypothetical protein